MHLLTLEAIASYDRALAPGGLLMFHISNKYVNLEPVLAAAAQADGWQIAVRDYRPDATALARRAAPSLWVAMSRSPATLAKLRASDRSIAWRGIAGNGMTAWTDDYGSILPLLKASAW